MKASLKTIALLVFIGFLFSCTGTRRFGTTIERDEQNPCQINMIIQIGVQGTDADVTAIRTELEACFNKECFIPCEPDKSKGCKTKISVVVKKWSQLSEAEQSGFHYVNMIDDDGLPSNAYIGTPNSGTSSGTWRRKIQPGVFCHEVLHLCGLEDQYCSRLYDPVTGNAVNERNCATPPDPNGGSCCTPTASHTRCGSSCEGHDHDLMATTSAPLSCENILDVLKLAGFANCPPECCNSNQTFIKAPDAIHITPGYLLFGDKSTKFGAYGLSVGYTKTLSSTLGITLDAGYYINTEKENSFKQNSGLLNISAGINFVPGGLGNISKKLTASTHVGVGISNYSQKTTITGAGSNTQNNTSLLLNAGAALDLKAGKRLDIRLLQADYTPTFFFKTTQHNFRLSAGILYKLR